MKSLSIRGFAAVSLVAAFMFFGCSDDSSPVVTDDETGALSSSDDSVVESSSSSKKVSSSSAEEKSSSSSKKTKKSSSSTVEDDETDSSSSLEKSSSSELVIVVPDQSDFTITASELSSRIVGDEARFKGQFSLDVVGDSAAVDSSFNIDFIGIEYLIGKGNPGNMVAVNVPVNSNKITFPTQNAIDLTSKNSAFVTIDLLNPGFTECGTYSLIVTVTASSGDRVFQRTEIIPFERDAYDYCGDVRSSSSAVQVKEIPMTTCQVELSTNVNPGLDLATCTAVPVAGAATADIIFSKVGSSENLEISATSGNGTQIAPITNGDLPPYSDDYEVDIWPEDINVDRVPATAYVSDFKYKNLGTTLSSMIENSNQIYVATTTAYDKNTGAGFYAFALTDITEVNDENFNLVIKVYKVQ